MSLQYMQVKHDSHLDPPPMAPEVALDDPGNNEGHPNWLFLQAIIAYNFLSLRLKASFTWP